MKIIFMGTPDFAKEILSALYFSRHEVISVYTGVDKGQNRGHKIQKNPVKLFSEEKNITLFQPLGLKSEDVIKSVTDQNADIIIVAAYGKILPKEILNGAKYGAINVHGSLLPKYRGAAPIQWAILNGEKETGVTIMQMSAGLDCGDMLYKKSLEIGSNETSGELFERLADLGKTAIIEALDLLEQGRLNPVPQNDSDATYAPMLTKEMSSISFSNSAQNIKNQVYGLFPWPCAKTTLEGTPVKILECEIADVNGLEPGEILVRNKEIFVGCKDGTSLKILKLQKVGKNPLSAKEFLNGTRIKEKTFFEWRKN